MPESTQAAAEVMLRQYESQYEAGHLTWEDFASDATAVLAAGLGALRQQVQQARKDYYDQAIGHGELTGHDEQEARAFGRVEAYDEVLGWLAGTATEGETTP